MAASRFSRVLVAMTLVAAAFIGSEPVGAQNPLAAQQQALAAVRGLLDDGDLHVILCGTSGPIYGAERAGPCTAILGGGKFFLVDAGQRSAESANALNLPIGDLSALLITHFHSDHIADIAEINFNYWTRSDGHRPLDVWGGDGIDRVIAGFNEAYALDLGYRLAHHGAEIMPPEGSQAVARTIPFTGPDNTQISSAVIYDQDGFKVTAFLVEHPPIVPALGYRFDFAGRSVVVSGDTVRSAQLIESSKGVDLLVHEAIADQLIKTIEPMLRSRNPRGATILVDALTNHTYPPDVYALAQEAGVSALVLSHLVPALPAAQAAQAFGEGKSSFSGPSWIGEDGMHFVLPASLDPVRLAD